MFPSFHHPTPHPSSFLHLAAAWCLAPSGFCVGLATPGAQLWCPRSWRSCSNMMPVCFLYSPCDYSILILTFFCIFNKCQKKNKIPKHMWKGLNLVGSSPLRSQLIQTLWILGFFHWIWFLNNQNEFYLIVKGLKNAFSGTFCHFFLANYGITVILLHVSSDATYI